MFYLCRVSRAGNNCRDLGVSDSLDHGTWKCDMGRPAIVESRAWQSSFRVQTSLD